MQNELLFPPATLPDVQPAPFWEVMLFEQPWALMIFSVLFTLGLVAFLLARGKTTVAFIILPDVIILPAVFWFVAYTVTTTREEITAQAREVVAAVAAWDADALDPLVSSRVQTVFFQAPQGWDKDQLLGWVRSNGSRYTLSDYEITAIRAQSGPVAGGGRTRVEVRVVPTATERPTGFICMMDWVLEDDLAGGPPVWRVHTITPLWVQGYGELQAR